MIYNILNEYKSIFGFSKKYLQYYRKIIIFLSISSVLLGVAVISAICVIFKISWPLVFLGGVLALAIPFSKMEINRIVKDHYNCKSTSEVTKLLQKRFELKLRQKKIDVHNIEQIDYLICLLEQKTEEMKPGLYIKGGIFAGILGPLWLCYLGAVFSYTSSLDEATGLFLSIASIIIMIIFMYISIKYGFIDEFLYSDYSQMKSLRNLIKEYRLIYMNMNCKGVLLDDCLL